MFLINILIHILVFLYMNHISLILFIGMNFGLTCDIFYCLHGVFFHLASICVSTIAISMRARHCHTDAHRHTPLLSLCHVFVQFFSCFSHLCSCHVLVPVHQWASVLSTRSPWPKMSEQAAARQVHCAVGLCFTSSHPCTSCSVMLTVIESKQATASEADGKGLCFLETWIPAVWTSTALLWSSLFSGVLGVSWREVLCCALCVASKTLLC